MGYTELHKKILEQTLSIPTAPFYEHGVAAFIENFAKNLGFDVEKDIYGNLIIRYLKGPTVPALGIVAHMDHPGFEVISITEEWVTLQSLGGVAVPQEGNSLLCVGVQENFVAQIAKVIALENRVFHVQIPKNEIKNPQNIKFAMYNLELFRCKDDKIYSHAIDDLAGCAAMLCVLEFLHREQCNADVYFLFTRAEEVGFVGASGIALGNCIPKDLPLISLEASKWLVGAEQGKGVIVRIGDKANIFESNLSKFLLESAENLAKKKQDFLFQSRIMDGGSCEASLFSVLGYSASGLALPLDCYHNIGKEGVTEENIAFDDWKGMVDLLCYASTNTESLIAYRELLMTRYLEKFRQYREKLKSSVSNVT